MNTDSKANILSESSVFDVCSPDAEAITSREQQELFVPKTRKRNLASIYYAALPHGGCVPVYKVLLTNCCEKNCYYCGTRCNANIKRTAFSPEELASYFMALVKNNMVSGIFLSSGILHNALTTQDRMIKSIEILRKKYAYTGYVHLKILPGADIGQVERAIQIADRVSINCEAPHRNALAKIAPEKDMMSEIFKIMRVLRALQLHGKQARSGYTTQFVIGAAGETDQEIIDSVNYLYQQMGLERSYFSAFTPVAGTPLESIQATHPLRQHRLYQADFLMRTYHYKKSDLIFDAGGNLLLDKDPKQVWAERHPELFPIEINTATREELMRVPGIGYISARKILNLRKEHSIQSPQQLHMHGIRMKQAVHFLLFSGKLHVNMQPAGGRQLELFTTTHSKQQNNQVVTNAGMDPATISR